MNWNTAAKRLNEEHLSILVQKKDGTYYTSTKKGVAPILDKMKEDIHYFKDAYVLDRVIGKAAAMLLLLSGAKQIHAQVMSKKAKAILEMYEQDFSYDTLCEYVINRTKDGLCPMEKCVWNMNDLHAAYEALIKKQEALQKGEKEMKKLGFGCMRFPLLTKEDQTSIDYEQVKQMVDTFIEKGFTYFDTAYMYHNFASEKAVKEVLVDRYPREAYTLATKLPTMLLEGKSEDDLEDIFNEQLEKTGVEYFDYYLLHHLNTVHYEVAKKLNAFAFIEQKKKEGKVKQIGFSFHDRAEVLDRILNDHPEVDFVQLQINYLDWDHTSIQSRLCYEVACKHNKPVVVMEPVKGGMLANIPEKAEQVFKAVHPEMSAPSWAVRFAASLDNVMVVLSGMSSQEQMLDNTSYMEHLIPLNEEEHATIQKVVDIINESVTIPCTACRYCVDGCPKHIPIPEYFALFNNKRQAKKKGHSLHNFYYNNYTKTHGRANECIACKKCEKSCPQNIRISEWLKEVSEEFDI